MNELEIIKPEVNAEREFLEITTDFGNPFEIFREAISNSYDHDATIINISVTVEIIQGEDSLVIEIEDNGTGMSKDILKNNFWALGNSTSLSDITKIGEKGHGTKIFLRSSKVLVTTSHSTGSFESECKNPYRQLSMGKMHTPTVREIDSSESMGTTIRVEGYNQNVRAGFLQVIIRDYIYWFTRHGSFAKEFDSENSDTTIINLKYKIRV